MPKKVPARTTPSRKREHVEITLTQDVGFQSKSNGLEKWQFVHNALPELNLSEIDTTVEFLGRRLTLPFIVSSMTGGYPDALKINRELAEVCGEFGIAMGVGSQRQAMEDTRYHRTFSIVREVAQTIPVIGNIGAAEVASLGTTDQVRRLADLIRADGFAVHLNAVQEFLQPEGNTNFRGVLSGIEQLVRDLPVPVIVKEIGAGISAGVTRRLLDAGVRYIDVAGAGGTSWAGVETLRRKDRTTASLFWDWGIPTADAVHEAAQLKSSTRDFTLIASGGIKNGLDAAKCIALGAQVVAAARPMLVALHRHKKIGLRRLIQRWADELRGAMFLTGSSTIDALSDAMITRTRVP